VHEDHVVVGQTEVGPGGVAVGRAGVVDGETDPPDRESRSLSADQFRGPIGVDDDRTRSVQEGPSCRKEERVEAPVATHLARRCERRSGLSVGGLDGWCEIIPVSDGDRRFNEQVVKHGVVENDHVGVRQRRTVEDPSVVRVVPEVDDHDLVIAGNGVGRHPLDLLRPARGAHPSGRLDHPDPRQLCEVGQELEGVVRDPGAFRWERGCPEDGEFFPISIHR
jgi:hypothetical protein